MKKFIVLALLLSALSAGWAKKREIVRAPVPGELLSAKTVYLLNAQTSSAYMPDGGNELAFDALYTDMKEWGRYTLVGSPEKADIVLELQYSATSETTGAYSTYNSYTRSVQTYSDRTDYPVFTLSAFDAKSKDLLWTGTDERKRTFRTSARKKEVIKSIDRLVGQLKGVE